MIKIEITHDGELSYFVIKKGREKYLLHNFSDVEKSKLLGALSNAYDLIKYSMPINKI